MASRILLADDSITIQKVVNLTFADEGIEVIAVSNGDVAERRLVEVNPDLVLADIFMPGKNGYELCEAIKENAQFRNVPVVLLVGAFEPFDQAEARRVRADAHLTKPFESRTLVETVRRLISASWRSTTGPIAMPAAPDQQQETYDSQVEETSAESNATQFVSAFEPSALVETVAPSDVQVRSTGELASPSPEVAPEVRNDGLKLSLTDAPEVSAVSVTLTDTSERFEPLEYSPNGHFSPAEVPAPFPLSVPEPHSKEEQLSHEVPEPDHAAPIEDSLPLETMAPGALHEVNISGAGEGEQWISAGSFDTSRLDRPSDDGWRAGANGSASNYQSADFTAHADVAQSASEAGETACATLLAVDEPLGDVLFGESASITLMPLEMSSSDALGLELGEPEVDEIAPAMSTQFDLVEIVEEPTAEAPAPEASVAEAATTEASVAEAVTTEASVAEALIAESMAEAATPEPATAEAPATEAPTAFEETTHTSEQVTSEVETHLLVGDVEHVTQQAPVSADAHETAEASHIPDPQPISADGQDWTTPQAASYSTAQLDSVVMPIESPEEVAPNSSGEAAPQLERDEEASFTAPAAWAEEAPRFTPIDVEPAAVDNGSSDESSAPAATVPQPATTDQMQSTDRSSEALPASSLSPGVIEEIVRRVVAEMTESVVREVAWEVVPDCVERVIDQLTRESLSKRA